MSEKSDLRAERRALPVRERLRLSWFALSGRAAQDGKSARMVALESRQWLSWEPVILGLTAFAARAVLGTAVLKQLYATREPPGWTMVHISWTEILTGLGIWAATSAALLAVSRAYRRAERVNDSIAEPPIEGRRQPQTPLSRGARVLIGANVVMVVLIVVVCLSPQTGFSALWAAYFSAEALLLVGTFVFALRRRRTI